ncbi:MAG: hypothetical protein CM15mP49_16780 [Actinomycetota bacterium]|nr:MAG: hypothetical protein CM15mP49_16780 [Actinomycetota bacterium]
MYEAGKGLSMADHFEIDDVIDPQDSRQWIIARYELLAQQKKRTEETPNDRYMVEGRLPILRLHFLIYFLQFLEDIRTKHVASVNQVPILYQVHSVESKR